MKKKYKTREQELYDALLWIAKAGNGMKPEVVDWANVGKNAKSKAREVIAGKCESCGAPKPFKHTG